MTKVSVLGLIEIAGFVIALGPSVAIAGSIKIPVIPGGAVHFAASTTDGSIIQIPGIDGGVGDLDRTVNGSVSFIVPFQDTIEMFATSAEIGGGLTQETLYELAGEVLPVIEPFSIPQLIPTSPLVRPVQTVAVGAFLAEGSMLTVGQSIGVTNGVIIQTAAIRLLDGSSLPLVLDLAILFDPSVVLGLPGLTGTATVGEFVELTPIPEPSALLLLASSLAGLGGCAWRRQRRE